MAYNNWQDWQIKILLNIICMCSLYDLYVLVRVEDLVEGELYVSEADAECPAPH